MKIKRMPKANPTKRTSSQTSQKRNLPSYSKVVPIFVSPLYLLAIFVVEISGMGKTFGSKFSPKLQRKKPKASVALMKVFPNELEAQKNFDGFTEWLQTFELYRGKQGEEIFEDEGRVVGKFKVRFGCVLHIL